MAPKVNFGAEKQDDKQEEVQEVQRSKKSYSALLVPREEDADHQSTAPKTIHEAAERGNTGFIDNLGRTALHWAAELNRIQAAEALLDYGIDITIPESTGRTAVHLAARAGHAGMLQTITEGIPQEQKEALINQPDSFGITPVYLALQK
ncbi:ankyrin repeat-containing domain protein [Dunaliella salina]|uniref:Ankyrin repeat-containing domain protein n=1 Tax=Dunaliella salina TaxID=3046 RepID=A0ABQ7GT14_DUNSA|nr:ankyrin repeat-containing domain protein [Dunaliella salina]|eukprot:KAF5837726.1 ankyrin repeat-containing domain protein [Dunaliella salina]